MKKFIKPLDNQCSFFEGLIATIAMIPKFHSFIVIETENIFLSVDYYDSSHGSIQIRVCQNMDNILDCQVSKKRKQSTIAKPISGGLWEQSLEHLLVRDFFIAVVKAKPQKDFNKLNNNCHTFSQSLWKILKSKQNKAKLAY